MRILGPTLFLTLEVFVLPHHALQVVQGLLVGVLQLEQLGAHGSGLPLRDLQFRLALLQLLFPVTKNLTGGLGCLNPSRKALGSSSVLL